MKKEVLLVGALACALSLPLVGCNSSDGAQGTSSGGDAQQSQSSGEFNAIDEYYGQWHGYVETTGQSVYGTTGGVEPMLDVQLEQDGTCTVEPTDAHADLLTDEGTWEGVEGQVTLHLSSGDITMTIDGDKAEANAADFGIADFDVIKFDFYG